MCNANIYSSVVSVAVKHSRSSEKANHTLHRLIEVRPLSQPHRVADALSKSVQFLRSKYRYESMRTLRQVHTSAAHYLHSSTVTQLQHSTVLLVEREVA